MKKALLLLLVMTGVSEAQVRQRAIYPIDDRKYFLFEQEFDSNDFDWDGGTLTLPTFTEGSIIFADPNGDLFEDNANLFFDDTNDYMGVGLNTPNNTIQVLDLIEFYNALLNTEIGYQAGNAISVGTKNTLGGYQAGLYVDSNDNTAWGYRAVGGGGAGASASYPLLYTTTSQSDPGLTETTEVTDLTELQAMENDLTGNYYLSGDIDASGSAALDGGLGFDPIGTSGSPFTGTFDGNGYTISGLVINRPTENGNGLFGYARGTAKIANVTVSVTITSKNYTGAIVGYIDSQDASEPLIQNCHSSGTLTAGTTDGDYYGGIVGWAQGHKASVSDVLIYDCTTSCSIDTSAPVSPGTSSRGGGFVGLTERVIISNCSATGTVSNVSPTANLVLYTGGFVGELDELTYIDYCFATGNVAGDDSVGGFLGYTPGGADPSDAYIRKCYSTGNATGTDNVGGFAGVNRIEVTDCYATGDATGTAGTGDIGGFTGIDFNPSTTADYSYCYATGAVTGGDNRGGFIANSQSGVFTDNYWDTETTGQATSDEGTGHTTAWLQTQANYPGTWDFNDVWYMEGGNILAATGVGAYALTAIESGGDYTVGLGAHAGEGALTTLRSIYLGAYSGYNQTTLDQRFIVDNRDRGSAANEVTGSILYGVMNSTASSQTLNINAVLTLPYGGVFLTEQADAIADVAGDGQIWVNTATPNELWFTTDAGDDIQLTSGTGMAAGTASADTEVLYDNSGVIDGDSTFTFNDTTKTVSATNLSLGGFFDVAEIAAPATPAADTLRLYVEDIEGFSFYKYLDSGGMKREVLRDSMILVYNNTGSQILANRVVYASGSFNNFPTVALARSNSISTMPAIGVTIENINDTSYGRVMQVGLLENIDTSALSIGDILYVHDTVAGLVRITAPLTPNLTQEIGTVLVDNATTGAIQIIAKGLTGDEYGTAQNTFSIGDGTAGSKVLVFNAATATDAQIWVNTATPNELWFTNNAGDAIQLTSGTYSGGGSAIFTRVSIDNASTYIDSDGSNNMTFTDAVVGTKTLQELGSPTYKYIKATSQSEGDLHFSDGTNWNVSKALIKMVRVVTSSTNWELYILQNDNGHAANDANIPEMTIMGGASGDANIYLDLPYEDEDASNEVHFFFDDVAGSNTADIYVLGYGLI